MLKQKLFVALVSTAFAASVFAQVTPAKPAAKPAGKLAAAPAATPGAAAAAVPFTPPKKSRRGGKHF